MFASLKTALRPFRLYRAARFGWHFATDPIFRRDHLLLWRRADNLFQHRSITSADRYPAIFKFVREHLAGRAEPRLLSFGCATGEEVFSLRNYFPRSRIKGIDINAANIATCRTRDQQRGADSALIFAQGSSANDEPAGFYDAVFCMAVFVRPQLKADPAIASCESHLRFEDFSRSLSGLAACVRPGGLLIVRHSMFRFTDTESARDFRLLLSVPNTRDFFPRFGPDNRRLPDLPLEEVVFEKITAPDSDGAAHLR